MRQLRKGFYDAGVEEELLREMCAACRQYGVDIPIQEIAKSFDKALHIPGKLVMSRHAIRMIAPFSDWKLEKVLIFLKICNLGYDINDENFGDLNEVLKNYVDI